MERPWKINWRIWATRADREIARTACALGTDSRRGPRDIYVITRKVGFDNRSRPFSSPRTAHQANATSIMMNLERPHYLLYCLAAPTSSERADDSDESFDDPSRLAEDGDERQGGCWEFLLEAADGSSRLEVTEREELGSGPRLELLAVVRGLEALDQPSRVTLITNSRYVRQGLRFGLPHWRENHWHWERFGRMVPVRNADLWQRLDRAMEIHDVACRTWRIDQSHGSAVPAPATRKLGRRSRFGAPGQHAARQARSTRWAPRRVMQWAAHFARRRPERSPVGLPCPG